MHSKNIRFGRVIDMRKFFRKASKMLIMALVGAMVGVFGIVLPVNPSTSTGTAGKDYKLYVNTGTAVSPVWTEIGGQRNSPLNRDAETIDVSHKSSGGDSAVLAGLRSWSIDLDGLSMLVDAGVDAIEQAFDESAQVNIKFEKPDKRYRTGWGVVTGFSIDPPHDGEATISGTIEGVGGLSAWTPSYSPATATMSKAAAADKVFSILPTTTTVSGVTDDGAAVTITSGYTYSSGTLTIKGTYLATVAIGVHTIIATTGGGEKITVQITITA